MEFADTPKKKGLGTGLKQRLYSAIDRQPETDKNDAIRRAKEETLRARQAKIAEEREYRSNVRAGRQQGGTGSYIKSVITEKNESRKARNLAEDLNPTLKTSRLQDREMRNMESRQKWRKRFAKVDGAFDQINAGFDKVDGTLNGKGKGGGNGFGLSEKDMNELAGIGGSGKARKGKSNGGSMGFGFEFGNAGGSGGFSQAEINELAGLSGGRRSNSSGTRRKKTTTHHKKAHRRAAPRSRSIFDIDI